MQSAKYLGLILLILSCSNSNKLEHEILIAKNKVNTLEIDINETITILKQNEKSFEESSLKFQESTELYKEANELFKQSIQSNKNAILYAKINKITFGILMGISQTCAFKMTTESYRSKLMNEYVNLTNKDIDHAFPKSWGGADNILNYEIMNSSKNRSLGNNLGDKFLYSPWIFVEGFAISVISGIFC